MTTTRFIPGSVRAAVLTVCFAWAAALLPVTATAQEDPAAFPAYQPHAPEAATEAGQASVAPESAGGSTDSSSAYHIQRGDLLTVSVWKETDLQSEVTVRPDGGISIPLAGDLDVAGHTVEEVRAMVDERLRKYIPDPVVTVTVKQISGNRIYVVGKVNKPGDFPLIGSIDVMQALGLAGGTTPFASLNHIRVLRRENGKETSIRFRYEDIEQGRALDQNIILHGGDTVVVP